MLRQKNIAVLGTGKMGETLISSLLDAEVIGTDQISATIKHEKRCAELAAKYSIEVGTDNAKAAADADIILLCVKPYAIGEVVESIKSNLRPTQVLISIAAGVVTQFIESITGPDIPVIRAMPNTPCLIKKGMTGMCAGKYVTPAHLELAESIFSHVGRTMVVDEKHMDAVTGLGASGPAFIYVVIESMAEGGVKAGLPRNLATELAAQAVLGSASMVLETGQHPALLKDAVTTPAGCTIDGLMELEEGGLRNTLIKTVVRAKERAAELLETK